MTDPGGRKEILGIVVAVCVFAGLTFYARGYYGSMNRETQQHRQEMEAWERVRDEAIKRVQESQTGTLDAGANGLGANGPGVNGPGTNGPGDPAGPLPEGQVPGTDPALPGGIPGAGSTPPSTDLPSTDLPLSPPAPGNP